MFCASPAFGGSIKKVVMFGDDAPRESSVVFCRAGAKHSTVMVDVLCYDDSCVNLRFPLSLLVPTLSSCTLKNRWAKARWSRIVFERLESIFQLANGYSMSSCGFWSDGPFFTTHNICLAPARCSWFCQNLGYVWTWFFVLKFGGGIPRRR